MLLRYWSLHMVFFGWNRALVRNVASTSLVLSLVFGGALSAAPAWSRHAAPGIADDPQAARFVGELMGRMTLDEKLGQMTQLSYKDKEAVPHEDRIRRGQVGSLLFVTDPVQINRLQHIAVDETRLHIPLIYGYDVVHGFRTIYPIPLALA